MTIKMLYLLRSLIETAFFLNLLLVPLQILDHQVLSRQLKMVPVVIDPLRGIQVKVVEDFVNGVPFDPENVPVLPIFTISK